MTQRNGPLHVLVVDDHPLVLSGVCAHLRAAPDIGRIDTADDGAAALAAVDRAPPDVVVLDISLPDLSGFDVAQRLQQVVPGCPILFLTMHADEEAVVRAVECGACGYVLKSEAPEQLLEAVRGVAAGDACFSSAVSHYLVRRYVAAARPAAPAPLTPRERQVLALLSRGQTNRKIAARLELSLRTVQTYRERMMKKLDLHCVADLTRYAIAQGLVTR